MAKTTPPWIDRAVAKMQEIAGDALDSDALRERAWIREDRAEANEQVEQLDDEAAIAEEQAELMASAAQTHLIQQRTSLDLNSAQLHAQLKQAVHDAMAEVEAERQRTEQAADAIAQREVVEANEADSEVKQQRAAVHREANHLHEEAEQLRAQAEQLVAQGENK